MTTLKHIKLALERADKVVTLTPSRGQRTYRNTAVIADGLLCRAEEKGVMLLTDAGKGLGGSDDWPTPDMLLRSALGSCIAIGIKMWAARLDLIVDHVEVMLEADADARGILGLTADVVPGFTEMRLEIAIRSPECGEDIEAMVAQALKYSPMLDVVTNTQPIAVETRIERSAELVTLGGRHGG